MTNGSPWDDIAIPLSDYNVKRLAGKMAVSCYWGRDPSGGCLFIVELDGNHATEFRQQTIRVNGIEIDLRIQEAKQRLVLTLEKQADRDLFEGLCRTLARALESAGDSASSLSIALTHLRRWKTFMSGRNQHLSADEVRGLFAELIFLRELISQIGTTAAVEAWMGPERSHQDFIFRNTAVEIKSVTGTERNSVRISSEDQLETLNDNLFLRIYRLSNLPNSPSARSLNELVVDIQDKLDTAEAIESFDGKLVAHAYAPLPDYDEPLLVVSDTKSYRVGDNFPRIVRSGLPAGITKVAYDIKLESIATFECDELLEAQ
jgi:hypothetical protein